MPTGIVEWLTTWQGYGFTQPEDGSGDGFVHISAVQKPALDTLNEGQKVTREVVRGGYMAAQSLWLAE